MDTSVYLNPDELARHADDACGEELRLLREAIDKVSSTINRLDDPMAISKLQSVLDKLLVLERYHVALQDFMYDTVNGFAHMRREISDLLDPLEYQAKKLFV